MLGNIKNRFWSLQEDITSSVRQFTPTQNVEEAIACDGINPYAGGGLLEAWQMKWEELHRAHEKNARKAAKCDRTITKINNAVDNQWKNILTLQGLGNLKFSCCLINLEPICRIADEKVHIFIYSIPNPSFD